MAKEPTTASTGEATEAPKKRNRRLDENGQPLPARKRPLFIIYPKANLAGEDGTVNFDNVTFTRDAKEAMKVLGASNGASQVATVEVA